MSKTAIPLGNMTEFSRFLNPKFFNHSLTRCDIVTPIRLASKTIDKIYQLTGEPKAESKEAIQLSETDISIFNIKIHELTLLQETVTSLNNEFLNLLKHYNNTVQNTYTMLHDDYTTKNSNPVLIKMINDGGSINTQKLCTADKWTVSTRTFKIKEAREIVTDLIAVQAQLIRRIIQLSNSKKITDDLLKPYQVETQAEEKAENVASEVLEKKLDNQINSESIRSKSLQTQYKEATPIAKADTHASMQDESKLSNSSLNHMIDQLFDHDFWRDKKIYKGQSLFRCNRKGPPKHVQQLQKKIATVISNYSTVKVSWLLKSANTEEIALRLNQLQTNDTTQSAYNNLLSECKEILSTAKNTQYNHDWFRTRHADTKHFYDDALVCIDNLLIGNTENPTPRLSSEPAC